MRDYILCGKNLILSNFCQKKYNNSQFPNTYLDTMILNPLEIPLPNRK